MNAHLMVKQVQLDADVVLELVRKGEASGAIDRRIVRELERLIMRIGMSARNAQDHLEETSAAARRIETLTRGTG